MNETFTLPVAVYERMMLMLESATQNAREAELPKNMTDDFNECVYDDELEACQSIIDRVKFAYENRGKLIIQ